ncbi:MAG: hypothetical protein JNK49_18940 [Planctomycetes bacterium]|nr:hypothetical protein [Planctomycetota bacterium]
MSYDPYAYGQVKLGGKPADPAATPDDLLFAAPAAPPAGGAAATADSSWELLQTDVASLLPNSSSADPSEFGTEILGEVAPPPAPVLPARPKAGAPRPAPARSAGGETAAVPASGAKAAPVGSGFGANGGLSGAKVTRSTPVAMQKPAPRPAAGLAATLLPGALLATGGTASAWLWFVVQNPVLGGIAAGLTGVSAAFAFVWARR